MTKKRTTKRALLLSALSLLMCVSMLVGSTFAWFTDSVTSGVNKIVAGNLDIEVYYAYPSDVVDGKIADSAWKLMTSDKPVFDPDALWEPGYTQLVYFKIKNVGSLAAKYQFRVDILDETPGTNNAGEQFKLSDKIQTYVNACTNRNLFESHCIYTERDIALNPVGAPTPFYTSLAKAADGTLANDEGANSLKLNHELTLMPADKWDSELYATFVLWMPTDVGNEANYKTGTTPPQIDLGITVLATQNTYEADSFNNQYDKAAGYDYVSAPVKRPTAPATEPESLKSGSPTPVEVELPADTLNNLPADVEEVKLTHTKPVIDESAKTIKFEAMELVDQDGKEIDLEAANNTTPITVSFPVPESFNGKNFDIYHDGELVASVTAVDGKITYTALHFCEINVKPFDTSKGTPVTNADELVAALENREDVFMMNDIKIDPANMSNAYGKTGINVKYGQTIDGNGFTLDIKGAGGTWDSGINTTGGVIKNIKVTGSFRGIFINHTSTHSEPVVLENVTLEGVTYTISCDQGLNQTLIATNCTFNGWTSYAATLGTAKFINCNFGEGNGYAYCRPYCPTEFVGCTFSAGYTVDETRTTVTFTDCIKN